MKLFIVNNQDKKCWITSSGTTRTEVANISGEVFTLVGSDYKYHVNEIKAMPDKDTSWGWAILIIVIFGALTQTIIVPTMFAGLFFGLAKIYYLFDLKRADRFNLSRVGYTPKE